MDPTLSPLHKARKGKCFTWTNLELANLKTLQMDLPRVAVFNDELLQKMVEAEKIGKCHFDIYHYGKHRVRGAREVCYTRGWISKDMKEWEKSKEGPVTLDELQRLTGLKIKSSFRLSGHFPKKVPSGEDYLNSEFIRAEFTGEHINYETICVMATLDDPCPEIMYFLLIVGRAGHLPVDLLEELE
ncbi:hypothetical protein EJB05_22791, partial [Eragrostis curvula]